MPGLLLPSLRIALAVAGPSGAAEALGPALVTAIEEASAAVVEVLEPGAVAACQGGFACLARAARPDYVRGELHDGGGTLLPYAAHQEAQRERGTEVVRLLIVVSVLESGGQRSAVTAVLDPDRALAVWHDAPRSTEDWESAVESRIDAELSYSEARPRPIGAALERAAYAAHLLEVLRPLLAAQKAWGPAAELVLATEIEGYRLYLDDEDLGLLAAGQRRLRPFPSGAHRVALRHPARASWEEEIALLPGQQRRVEIATPLREALEWPHRTAIIGGSALSLVGIGIGAAAIGLASAASPQAVCLGGVASLNSCPPPRRIDFGFQPSAPELPASGVPMAAVALGLIGLGASSAIGAWFQDPEELPWLPLGAGLLLGALGVIVGSTY